eukprot:559951_1
MAAKLKVLIAMTKELPSDDKHFDVDDTRRFCIDLGQKVNYEGEETRCCDECEAVIKEPLYEDAGTNSLQDSISLVLRCNEERFALVKQSSLFLVFNKVDLFETKKRNRHQRATKERI